MCLGSALWISGAIFFKYSAIVWAGLAPFTPPFACSASLALRLPLEGTAFLDTLNRLLL
jgi:hypothetical protein